MRRPNGKYDGKYKGETSVRKTDITMQDQKPSGKILRVKQGYNPNSSSVGSSLPVFFAFALASGALVMAGMHIAHFFKNRKKGAEEAAGTEEP